MCRPLFPNLPGSKVMSSGKTFWYSYRTRLESEYQKVPQDITFDPGRFGQQGTAQSIALDQGSQMSPTLVPESSWIKSCVLEYFLVFGFQSSPIFLGIPLEQYSNRVSLPRSHSCGGLPFWARRSRRRAYPVHDWGPEPVPKP